MCLRTPLGNINSLIIKTLPVKHEGSLGYKYILIKFINTSTVDEPDIENN